MEQVQRELCDLRTKARVRYRRKRARKQKKIAHGSKKNLKRNKKGKQFKRKDKSKIKCFKCGKMVEEHLWSTIMSKQGQNGYMQVIIQDWRSKALERISYNFTQWENLVPT